MKRALMVAVALWGCTNDLDDTPNRLLLADAEVVVELDAAPGAQACVPAVGSWFAFDTLGVVSLSGDTNHGAIPNLNSIWAGDIAKKQLNILFEVLEASETGLRVRAINAARKDDDPDDWCLVPYTATELHFVRDGQDLEMDTQAGINIYAGSESIPKTCSPGGDPRNTIPIREARLKGRLTNDCERIVEGTTVEAVMFAEALETICNCLAPNATAEACGALNPEFESLVPGCDGCNISHANLARILQSLTPPGTTLVVPGEDGKGRIHLEAFFTAARLTETPQSCAGL